LTLGLAIVVVSSLVIHSLRNGISPMPTAPKVKRILIEILVQQNIRGNIFELGSGWGSLAYSLAKAFPNSRVQAYENSPIPYYFSQCFTRFFPLKNLSLKRINFFNVSFTEADIIVCYLYPGGMRKLKSKFEQELRNGSLVISNTFAVPGWTPSQLITVDDIYRSRVYVYVMGLQETTDH